MRCKGRHALKYNLRRSVGQSCRQPGGPTTQGDHGDHDPDAQCQFTVSNLSASKGSPERRRPEHRSNLCPVFCSGRWPLPTNRSLVKWIEQ